MGTSGPLGDHQIIGDLLWWCTRVKTTMQPVGDIELSYNRSSISGRWPHVHRVHVREGERA